MSRPGDHMATKRIEPEFDPVEYAQRTNNVAREKLMAWIQLERVLTTISRVPVMDVIGYAREHTQHVGWPFVLKVMRYVNR